jgi:hypothetical protein
VSAELLAMVLYLNFPIGHKLIVPWTFNLLDLEGVSEVIPHKR